MLCANVREQLNSLCDGERLPDLRGYVTTMRHCLRCADCRAERRRLKRLRQLARRLPASPPPVALKARVLAALPDRTSPNPLLRKEGANSGLPLLRKEGAIRFFLLRKEGANSPSERMSPSHKRTSPSPCEGEGRGGVLLRIAKPVAGIAAVAAFIVMPLILPRSRQSLSLAAEVQQALQNVNTWHLKGWKLQDGKRVPWEVWGRRTPFFYREQLGADSVTDDGVKRTALFAGDRRQPQSLALRTPSDPQAKSVRWSYRKLVEKWRSDLKPWKETAEEVVFDLPDSAVPAPIGKMSPAQDAFFTIDKRTRLPIRYEARQSGDAARRTTALLRIEFDSPLPASLLTPRPIPQGYVLYDITQPPAGLPHVNAVSKDGVTAQFVPLAMDSDGNVLLQLRGWLGDRLLTPNGPFVINGYVVTRTEPDSMAGPPPTHDDRNRPYVEVNWDVIRDGDALSGSNTWLMLLTPVEPLPKGTPLPASLTLRAGVDVGMRGGDILDIVDSRLFLRELTLTVSLPKRTRPIDVEAYMKPGWRKRIITQDGWENRTAATYFARAFYYSQVISSKKPDRPRLTKAIGWLRKGIPASTTTGSVQLERGGLAELYAVLGDFKQARRALKEVISISERFPQRPGAHYYRRSAEMQLEQLDRQERKAKSTSP